ncbi:putative restriction endonuclease [Chloroherpeton thalassium ATCC 35110]|uniref:Putative restriction endonuclease n=1 Tax=Chloroherpeton thalassium (strain ATCC 35110 / GB-78) TaxID=517418 RepID=B3QWD3_CHLT3|nr:hypothetical protein [Chloroherpeton thalassium]ACF13246.1 putative restriction endonuclease [Chloroherpeton thalassium ATCC 35110]
MIPIELQSIVSNLIDQPITLTAFHSNDGRINSSLNELQIINCIQNFSFGFEIKIGREREWFDFAIKTEDRFYPVNIKVTDTTHADNLNCKLGIYYALTGNIPDFANEIKWESYFDKLNIHMGNQTTADYYFLVLNKQNPKDVFANTLRSLTILQPNGNNLPFQCRWDLNRQPMNRTFNDAKDFIMRVFGDSIKQRAKIYLSFETRFPDYV